MIKFVFKLKKNEVVLSDMHYVVKYRVYIVDGVFTRCPINGTLKSWKEVWGVKEVRSCIQAGHKGALLGDRVE